MESKKYKIKDKLFYIPIILFGIYLLIRLFDEIKLIGVFPLDWANDISSYMAQLHFLKVCGFHGLCQYWYNGYIAFLFTPPAWYFFTLPIYLVSGNLLFSTYISMILMYILGLFGFLLIGKLLKISNLKSIGLFFLFFVNPIAIGTFLRLGRVTTFFAWVVFIYLFAILMYYKDKPLDKYFLYFILIYSVLILSHFQELVLSSFLLLGFFLVKSNKERIYFILSGIISVILVSFWLVPFILNVQNSGLWIYSLSNWLLDFSGNLLITNAISMVVVILFALLFYLNWKQNRKIRKDLLFYMPSLVLSFLLLTRLVVFIPILKNIAPQPYIFYFTLFCMYLFVKTEYSKKLLKLISIGFVGLVAVSILISAVHTSWFVEHTQLEKDSLELLDKYVDGKYLIFGGYPTSYAPAYYSYTPIVYNMSTSSGWYPHASTKDYVQLIFNIYNNFESGNCEQTKFYLNKTNTTQIIGYTDSGYGDYCAKLKKCNFSLLEERKDVCIFNV